MKGNFFLIICQVPERISKYTSMLKLLTSNFLFFSNASSMLEQHAHIRPSLIVLDNVDQNIDIDNDIRGIRQNPLFATVKILMIVKDGCLEEGVEALNAGADDYLQFSRVDTELRARARMRLNAYESNNTDIELEQVYPIEDRAILKDALQHIRNNLPAIKTVNDLSLHISTSEKSINRAFRLAYGKTAFEYIREHRILKAKEMLSKTRFPITQIAIETGYSSSANFSTAFKSVVGLSPREYRCQSLLNM